MPDTIKTTAYTDATGNDVYEYLLRNNTGAEAVVSNYGAIIKNFRIAGPEGAWTDVVLGFDRMEDYVSPAYLERYAAIGCVIGRVANRIRNGAFEVDGEPYQVTRNLGDHHLHGGREGFGRKRWEETGYGTDPCPWVEFSFTSPDGDEGYPGELRSRIRFELNDKNELRYTIEAETDKATPVNFTHHGYFNLAPADADIRNHMLQIHSWTILKQDEDLIPTGDQWLVGETPYDFREPRRVGDGLQELKEYDSSYVVKGDISKPAARVKEPASGLTLELFTTEPIVHFYTGNWSHQITGKNGKTYGAFCGLCLETQKHPDAINVMQFPDTVLRPGETYRQQTIYRLYFDNPEK